MNDPQYPFVPLRSPVNLSSIPQHDRLAFLFAIETKFFWLAVFMSSHLNVQYFNLQWNARKEKTPFIVGLRVYISAHWATARRWCLCHKCCCCGESLAVDPSVCDVVCCVRWGVYYRKAKPVILQTWGWIWWTSHSCWSVTVPKQSHRLYQFESAAFLFFISE